MRKSAFTVFLVLVPVMVIAAGSSGLLERVPILPATVAQALSGLPQRASAANALQRDIDAAEVSLTQRLESAAQSNEEIAGQQQAGMEKFSGMSAEEMEAAEDGELEAKMLEGMGMSMADMEAMEDMDDAEIEAYFASKQFNTKGLAEFGATVPKGSDPVRLERLNREYSDWQVNEAARKIQPLEELRALQGRWAEEHTKLDAKLDTALATKLKNVRIVDCGEAGDTPDALAVHAIALERAKAHAELAPAHLQQGAGFLSNRREAVKADVSFADRFETDADGVDEMAMQALSAKQVALQRIAELLAMTLEVNRVVVRPAETLAGLENVSPKSECG